LNDALDLAMVFHFSQFAGARLEYGFHSIQDSSN
jgi:hypothetical protein